MGWSVGVYWFTKVLILMPNAVLDLYLNIVQVGQIQSKFDNSNETIKLLRVWRGLQVFKLDLSYLISFRTKFILWVLGGILFQVFDVGVYQVWLYVALSIVCLSSCALMSTCLFLGILSSTTETHCIFADSTQVRDMGPLVYKHMTENTLSEH